MLHTLVYLLLDQLLCVTYFSMYWMLEESTDMSSRRESITKDDHYNVNIARSNDLGTEIFESYLPTCNRYQMQSLLNNQLREVSQ